MDHSDSMEQVKVDDGTTYVHAVCQVHGAYNARKITYWGSEITSDCPECDREREARYEESRRRCEAEERQRRLEARLERASIPRRFSGKTFDTYEATTDAMRAAKSAAMAYAEGFNDRYEEGASLVLSGPPGTGKSHLACAIAHHVIHDGYAAMYVTAMDMVRMVRATWRRDSERSESDVLRDLAQVNLLVIDEIGMQYGTEGEQVILTDVIDMRYRDQLPIIVVTNQDKKGLREYLGHRAFDRLRDAGKWVSCDWESHRAGK